MGLFSRKPKPEDEVLQEYCTAVRAWCDRLAGARDAGRDLGTADEIFDAAGEPPELDTARIPGKVDQRLTIGAASYWLSTEAGRLDRQDVRAGRFDGWWQPNITGLAALLPAKPY